MALRSMQGIWTRPPTGSHVRPRLCSIPISAAFSTWAGEPPSTSVSPAAAAHGVRVQARADPMTLPLASPMASGIGPVADRTHSPETGTMNNARPRSPRIAVSRNRTTPSAFAPLTEPRCVVRHWSTAVDDAGSPRSSGRSASAAAAHGVLLVHGESEQVHPVDDGQRVVLYGVRLTAQLPVQRCGPPLQLETGQLALALAALPDARLHRLPDPQQAGRAHRLPAATRTRCARASRH